MANVAFFFSWTTLQHKTTVFLTVAFALFLTAPGAFPGPYHLVLYFWAWHAPKSIPWVAFFLLGLLEDVGTGSTLGSFFLEILGLALFVRVIRIFLPSQPFSCEWIGFAFYATCLFLGNTLLTLGGDAFSYVLLCLVYPVAAYGLVLLRGKSFRMP